MQRTSSDNSLDKKPVARPTTASQPRIRSRDNQQNLPLKKRKIEEVFVEEPVQVSAQRQGGNKDLNRLRQAHDERVEVASIIAGLDEQGVQAPQATQPQGVAQAPHIFNQDDLVNVNDVIQQVKNDRLGNIIVLSSLQRAFHNSEGKKKLKSFSRQRLLCENSKHFLNRFVKTYINSQFYVDPPSDMNASGFLLKIDTSNEEHCKILLKKITNFNQNSR
jgi:hypothetical protein